MESPLQIRFHGFDHRPELDELIRKRAEELDAITGQRLTSCHVVVELGHEHHAGARLFHARIDLALPGGVIAVNHEPHDLQTHEDADIAVRDAFDAAHRQIEHWQRKHHGTS